MAAAVWVLLLLLLAPGVAVAQTAGTSSLPSPSPLPGPYDPESDPRTPPPATIPSAPVLIIPTVPPGAARPTQLFEIHPLVGLTEEYTDNFGRVAKDKQDNVRSTVAPGLRVRLDRGSLTGEARYVLSAFHDTSRDDVSFFHSAQGGLAWEATPLFKLSSSASYFEGDRPSEADRLGLRQERKKFTTMGASLGAGYTLSNVLLQPSYRVSNFSESEGDETTSQTVGMSASTQVLRIHTVSLGYEYLDSETSGSGTTTSTSTATGSGSSTATTGHQVTGSVSRGLSERSSIGLTAAYAARTQEETRPERETDFNRWSASLFNSYAIPKTIALRGSVGVTQLTGGSASDDLLLTTLTSLSYWFGDAVATVSIERGFSESFSTGENFGVVKTTGMSGSLAYPFTPWLSGLGSISYRENEFTGVGGAGSATSTARTEDTLAGSLSLQLQVTRWLGSALGYSYSDTSANDSSRNVKENRFTLSLNASF